MMTAVEMISPPAVQASAPLVEAFRCSHVVAAPELGGKRLVIDYVAAADPHTVLCWLVARGFAVADQLDPTTAADVIQAVQDRVVHAELLAALESGHGYGLPLPVAEEFHTFEVRQPHRRAAVDERQDQEPA